MIIDLSSCAHLTLKLLEIVAHLCKGSEYCLCFLHLHLYIQLSVMISFTLAKSNIVLCLNVLCLNVFIYLFIYTGDNNIINGNSHIYSTLMTESYS